MRTNRFLLLLIVTTSAIYFFSVPEADNDLWGHLFFGREILAAGEIPSKNLYSYTAPNHPWINHELLAELTFAAIYNHLGSAGLLLLKLLLGFATLAILDEIARRRTDDPLARASALVLAAAMMGAGYLVRPQIFSFLALAIVWSRIHRHAGGNRQALRYLPLLFVLWVNTHGGVLAGEAVLLAYLAILVVTGSTERPWFMAASVAATSAIALLVNPYGFELPRFLFQDVLRDRPISEWQGIPLWDASDLHFKATVLVAASGVLLRRQRRAWEIIILAVAAVGAFRHQRHLPLFAIVATPYIAETFGAAIATLNRSVLPARPSIFPALVLHVGILAIAVVQIAWASRPYRAIGFQIHVSPELFPVHAVRFMQRNHLTGNLALPFDWGEYAIWHLYPSCRVSIDGRYTTAYPDDVIELAWRFRSGSAGWQGILEDANLVLADRKDAGAWSLFRDPAWDYIYSDSTALLFVRKATRPPEAAIRRDIAGFESAILFP